MRVVINIIASKEKIVAYHRRFPTPTPTTGRGSRQKEGVPDCCAELDRLSRRRQFINGVIGRNVHPTRLSFVQGRSSDLGSFERFFGCPVSGSALENP